MLKKSLIALAVVVVLAGCSKPQDTIIPSDMSQWDKELGPVFKKLSDEDRKYLSAFIMRSKMSEIFRTSAGIPIGMTIGDAIADQKKWEENKALQEAKEQVLREQARKEALAALKQITSAATVTLVKLGKIHKDYSVNRYRDQQFMQVAIQNDSQKVILGISGRMLFTDIFDKPFSEVQFTVEERIQPGQSHTTGAARDYNEFLPDQRALWETQPGKYKAIFIPDEIIFEDGERIKVPRNI